MPSFISARMFLPLAIGMCRVFTAKIIIADSMYNAARTKKAMSYPSSNKAPPTLGPAIVAVIDIPVLRLDAEIRRSRPTTSKANA